MIAITFAVPHESAGLRRAFQPSPKTVARECLRGEICGREVLCAHTGIGTESAANAVATLISGHRPRWLLSAGYAGALDRELAHASLFLATNFTAPELLARSNAPRGILTTQNSAAETPVQKAALALETNAQAVDMETSAIARVCAEKKVPLLSLRAISDTADARIPVPLEISFDIARQRPRVAALLFFLSRNPSRILPFARFVRGLAPARAALTSEIIRIIENEPQN